MQIKIIMRYLYAATVTAVFKADNTKLALMGRKQNAPAPLVGIQNSATALGTSFPASKKVKYVQTIHVGNFSPSCLPKRNEKTRIY